MEENFDGNLNQDLIRIDFENGSKGLQKIDKLCQLLIAKKGYRVLCFEKEGQVEAHGEGFDAKFDYTFIEIPELKPLAHQFDRILVKIDGLSFTVYCIKNGLDEPSRISMSLDQLREAGRSCLDYTGTFNGVKIPISIFVLETSNSIQTVVDHLRPLKCLPGRQKVAVRAYHLNFKKQEVWTNIPFGGIFADKFFLKNALGQIESNSELDLYGHHRTIKVQAEVPILTWAILGLFILIFGLSLFASQDALSPSLVTLITFGGVSRALIENGEYFRLISAGFLHSGYVHVLANCVAFYLGGVVLETCLGRAWLFSIFLLSILGGSLFSIYLNPPNTLAVGASGGIMGLLVCALFVLKRLPFGAERTRIEFSIIYIIVPASIPILIQREGERIDFASHMGGALVGLFLGVLILKSWKKGTQEPGLMNLAKAMSAIGGLAVVIAASNIFQKQSIKQSQLNIYLELAPEEEMNPLFPIRLNQPEDQQKVILLSEKYPNDPRFKYFKAMFLHKQKKLVLAGQQLRSALINTKLLDQFSGDPKLEYQIRSLLAKTLIDQSQVDEAIAAVQPICKSGEEFKTQWLSQDWLKMACDSSI